MKWKDRLGAASQIAVSLIVILMLGSMIGLSVSADKDTERRIKTAYNSGGRPVNQSLDAKGWHRVVGSVTLSSGRAIVTLNTSTEDGKQDVSFKNDSTYRITAWSLDTTNTNTYRGYPLSGSRFLVKSSDGGDNSVVNYSAEGE